MEKHYWLRCAHAGRKWIHSFHGTDDRTAIDAGYRILSKLSKGHEPGFSDFDNRRANDWKQGDVELVNQIGVVLFEYGAEREAV